MSLAAFVMLSAGVNLFIFKQMRVARAQAALSRVQLQDLSAQYQLKEPAMRQFVDALQTFAASHPDFRPILQRYRGTLPHFFAGPVLVVSNQMPRPAPATR